MKTSVIEVHGMLSALSAHDVEKRIGKVPAVESVTVNCAAEKRRSALRRNPVSNRAVYGNNDL